jgi:hypothetical protein
MKPFITTASGYTRIVVLIGKYAIKFPNPKDGQRSFVLGLWCNYNEYFQWKNSHHPKLGKVLFCFPLGLFQVMLRYNQLSNDQLAQNTINVYKDYTDDLPLVFPDCKSDNFGIDNNGKMVLLDYGNCM